MSEIPNALADAALAQAIAYDEDARTYQTQGDFGAAAHSGRLRESFFERAIELTNA